MRILVSGAYGFVGTNLARYLAARGHECVALDVARGDAPYADFIGWDGLGEIDWSAIDAIVHLAGKAHDLKKTARPEEYREINVGLTEKLFKASRGMKGPFVFFSSAKAVDGDTPYARSKREAEAVLGGSAVILRPAMIYGPGNKGNLNLLWGVAKRGLPWPLAAFRNARSFTSVENACAVVEAACAGRLAPGTYALCDGEPMSTNEIVEMMARAAGRKARLWRVPRALVRAAARAGDFLRLPLDSERLGKLASDAVEDNSALKKALGWEKMPVRAEDGMRETLSSFAEEEKRRGPRRPGAYRFVKRLLDIFLSACAILALSPLLLPVMLILKCTGEHDIFYGQERIGWRNKRFKILKFATMLRNSPNMAGGLHTTHGDPRVLPFGRFLRKTKINELPQLFNILLGDMSIVGPRPLVDKTFDPYPDEVKKKIYSVRPGLTGIGSVIFRDEETLLSESGMDPAECYAKRVAPYKGALEMWYLEHEGFVTDLKLVFLTAWVVLFPDSALPGKMFRDLPERSAD